MGLNGLNKYFELKKSHRAAAPTWNTCSLWSLLCYQYVVAIATNLCNSSTHLWTHFTGENEYKWLKRIRVESNYFDTCTMAQYFNLRTLYTFCTFSELPKTQSSTHTHTRAHAHARAHTHTHTHTHTHAHTYTHRNMHVAKYTHANICIHAL